MKTYFNKAIPGAGAMQITPFGIARFMLFIVAFLLIANLLVIYLRFIEGFTHLKGFIHGFYFDAEANFPSLYSALAILFAAVVLWLIGASPAEQAERRGFFWKFLSLVFAFLSIDEFASIHEYMIIPAQGILAGAPVKSNYLYFSWFVPYMAFVVLVGIILIRFYLKLPMATRLMFAASAVIFISGAVGLEMVGGKYWTEKGWAIDGSDPVDIYYALIITMEELLEMVGIVLFVYALTKYYLRDKTEVGFNIRITDHA